MECDNSTIISCFKKFPYGKWSKLDDGYRLATVYEAQRLLEAIQKSEDKRLAENLVPPPAFKRHASLSGSEKAYLDDSDEDTPEAYLDSREEAYRLKDGYLFDFGTLRTFYCDHEHQFELTHKLGVQAQQLQGVIARAPKLCLPLALLHACKEENEEEIQEIVKLDAQWRESNYIELNQVTTIKSQHLFPKKNHDSEKPIVTKNISSDHDQTPVPADDESEGALDLARLRLLKCGTPWVRGGTALHYAAGAGKATVVLLLLDLECDLRHAANGGGAGQQKMDLLVECQDYDGNIPLLCFVSLQPLTPDHTTGLLFRRLIATSNADFLENFMRVTASLGAANLLGDTIFHIAAQKGALGVVHKFTGDVLNQSGFGFVHLMGHGRFEIASPLDGNTFIHHAVLQDSSSAIFGGADYDSDFLSFISHGIWHRNHLGLSAFDVALNNGRSAACLSMLQHRIGLDPSGTNAADQLLEAKSFLDDPQCDYSRLMLDGDGNNILHRYAMGGADQQVGRLILQWLKLGESQYLPSSAMPPSERQFKQSAKVAEMIRELNVHGETPCISALNRGHSDAFEVLMELWGEELASQYLNPKTRDNIVHCYAKSSKQPGLDVEAAWSRRHPKLEGRLKELLNAPNKYGRTPLLCALAYGHVSALQWLLNQDGNLLIMPDTEPDDMSGSALHLLAGHFDDEAVATSLLQALGEDTVSKTINTKKNCWVETISYGRIYVEDFTPLDVAILAGHARTCKALLQEKRIDVDLEYGYPGYRGGTVLHLFCGGGDWKDDPAAAWQEIRTRHEGAGRPSPDLAKLVNAKNEDGKTPLMVALESGNIRACRWLLETHFDLLDTSSSEDADEVFRCFAQGGCHDISIWDKIKQAFLTQENVHAIWKYSLPAAFEGRSEACAMLFLKEPHALAAMDRSSRLSISSEVLRSFKVLAQISRDDASANILGNARTLEEAARGGGFQLFDMALQKQSCEGIDLDSLFHSIMRCKGDLGMIRCLLQLLVMKFAEESNTSLEISVDSWRGRYTYPAPAAWLWACLHLLQADPAAQTCDMGEGRHDESSDKIIEEHTATSAANNDAEGARVWREEAISDLDQFLDQYYPSSDDFAMHLYGLAVVQHLVKRINAVNTREGPEYMITLWEKHKWRAEHEPVALMLHLTDISFQKYANVFVSLLCSFVRRNSPKSMHAVFCKLFADSATSFYKTLKELISTQLDPAGLDIKGNTSVIEQKRTILHKAAESYRSECMLLLLSYFRRYRMEGLPDYEGKTILHYACIARDHDSAFAIMSLCPELLRVGRRSGRTPLHDSAYNGDVKILQDVLMFHQEPNALLNERDADGRTALHFAVASQNPHRIEIVRMLVDHAHKKGDYAALLLWASAGHLIRTAYKDVGAANADDVAQFLQEQMEQERKKIPDLLRHAIKRKNYMMARELINRGADIAGVPQETVDKLELYQKRESDQPAMTDYLGRSNLVKGIAALLLNPFTATPITIGVFGSWGMGKSSIMIQTEITLLMTIIERNVLPTYEIEEDFPREVSVNVKTPKAIELHRNITKAMKILKKKSDMLEQHVPTKSDFISCLSKASEKILCNYWPSKGKQNDEADWQDFLNNYRPECKHLYKGLAVMDRAELFKSSNAVGSTQSIPPCIVIYYNAWLYYGENEAMSGLALNVLKELESYMDTAQWLRLCWRYAYKSDPIYLFSNIMLPMIIFVCLGGWILWMLWKLLSLPSLKNSEALSQFKYGSLPVSMVIAAWFCLKNIINVAKPVSEQIAQSFSKRSRYAEGLGYQQKIINDIMLFKEQLGEKAGFGWRMLSKCWSFMVENKDYIASTNIKKAPIPKNRLRVIVFIDDLDRCSKSSYVLELLGAVNLVLSVCDINVVLGMDKDMIKEIIQTEFKDTQEHPINAAERFLEKIVQLPIELNESSEQDLSTFLQEQLLGRSNKDTDEYTLIAKEKNISLPSQDQVSPSRAHQEENEDDTMTLPQSDHAEGSISLDLDNLPQATHSNFPQAQIVEQQSNRLTTVEGQYSNIKYSKGEQEAQRKGSTLNDEPQHQFKKILTKASKRLVVEFPILVANYNRSEMNAFNYLQKRAKTSYRQPRTWKRLLNYHRLAWYIISQSTLEDFEHHYGWQEQLIVWVFICYNWKEQMNEIFQAWVSLATMLQKEDKSGKPTLHMIIRSYIKMKNLKDNEEWKDLEDTLFGFYDIDIPLVIVFQNYRFHCDAKKLHWE